MQSNFEISDLGNNQQHFIDTNSSSSLLPIFNPQKPNHHHFHHQLHQQPPPQPPPYQPHISQLVHPNPITHQLLQRQNHLQALQMQEEQQGRLHWQQQMSPVNFKLGLNENSGSNGDCATLVGPNNLGFKSWQTQDCYGVRKEPMWRALDVENEANKKHKQGDELESKYRLYGELEAIYSLAKMGEVNVNVNQAGSGSALTGEHSPKDLDFPVPSSDAHCINVAAPTEIVRVDNGSEASIGEEALVRKNQKRKRKRKMKEQVSSVSRFFEGLVKQVMDHQESLHQKYLEVIERMEEERMDREVAWRCQEAENHKKEAIARVQAQALASSREALIVSYIEKITGQSVNLPSRGTPLVLQPDNLNEPLVESTPSEIDHGNTRWPQAEVEALILARSSVDSKLLEPRSKVSVWEEVSALMASMGYQRSAKRCKEKWENINRYFRKTKDSGKKRPHSSKTCSYFDQLDQLYSRTPNTVSLSSSPYYPSNPLVSMDVGIQKESYSDLLEAVTAGRDVGVAQNFSNGDFAISEMGSSRLDFDGIADGKVEHVQGYHREEKEDHEDNENLDEKEDTDGDDDSDE